MAAAPPTLASTDQQAFYEGLVGLLSPCLEGERDPVCNLANASALLFSQMDRLNWAGFYLLKGGHLLVGPFQGKPACARIAMGKGVCGTAAARRETVVVPDVHEFPGHIACDAASQSEIVVPMVRADGTLVGVLDIDSPVKARFNDADARGLEAFVKTLLELTDL
jgi:L-methionine (R)-S-oxide reductase